MNLNTKIILTINENIKKSLLQMYSFNLEKNDLYEIYSYKRKNEEEETIIFFHIQIEKFAEILTYINENYIFDKFILIWNSLILRNQDLEEWDIIIPNTFLDKNWENPIFLEYAIWDNYDLNKFWLLLSWVCINWKNFEKFENKEEFQADIVDNDSYVFLKSFKREDLEKVVVIRNCIKEDSKSINSENLLNIMDVII